MEIFKFFKKKSIDPIHPESRSIKNISFNAIAKNVLSEKQRSLKPLLEYLSQSSFLIWWTSIALQLWHRESIDFDFVTRWPNYSFYDIYTFCESNKLKISSESIDDYRWIEKTKQDEIHIIINNVPVTIMDFYRTVYKDQKVNIEGNKYILWWLRTNSLRDLASMKLYAMITREKWKDAVDLYFLMKTQNFTFDFLVELSKKNFVGLFRIEPVLETIFNGKWDKREKVTYIGELRPSDDVIITFLQESALLYKKSHF